MSPAKKSALSAFNKWVEPTGRKEVAAAREATRKTLDRLEAHVLELAIGLREAEEEIDEARRTLENAHARAAASKKALTEKTGELAALRRGFVA